MNLDNKMPVFKTIRQTAASGLISDHYLRQMVKRGDCPGIKSGNRFLVNVTALEEMLNVASIPENVTSIPENVIQEAMLVQALHELKAFQRKYSTIERLHPVFEAISEIQG